VFAAPVFAEREPGGTVRVVGGGRAAGGTVRVPSDRPATHAAARDSPLPAQHPGYSGFGGTSSPGYVTLQTSFDAGPWSPAELTAVT